MRFTNIEARQELEDATVRFDLAYRNTIDIKFSSLEAFLTSPALQKAAGLSEAETADLIKNIQADKEALIQYLQNETNKLNNLILDTAQSTPSNIDINPLIELLLQNATSKLTNRFSGKAKSIINEMRIDLTKRIDRLSNYRDEFIKAHTDFNTNFAKHHTDLLSVISQIANMPLTTFVNTNPIIHLTQQMVFLQLQRLAKSFNSDPNTLENQVNALKKVFTAYNAVTQNTSLQYGIYPYDALNQLCIELCDKMAAVTKENGRNSLLYPCVTSSQSNITQTYFDDPELQLHHFVLSDDATRFIELQACFQGAEIDNKFKHTIQRDGQTFLLSETEKDRLIATNPFSAAYMDSIKRLWYFKNDPTAGTLGSNLEKLANGLTRGDAYHVLQADLQRNYDQVDTRVASQTNLGEAGNLAVVEFSQYLEKLHPEQKQKLFKLKVNGASEDFEQLWYKRLAPQTVINLNDTRHCGHLLAESIHAILKQNTHLYDHDGLTLSHFEEHLESYRHDFNDKLNVSPQNKAINLSSQENIKLQKQLSSSDLLIEGLYVLDQQIESEPDGSPKNREQIALFNTGLKQLLLAPPSPELTSKLTATFGNDYANKFICFILKNGDTNNVETLSDLNNVINHVKKFDKKNVLSHELNPLIKKLAANTSKDPTWEYEAQALIVNLIITKGLSIDFAADSTRRSYQGMLDNRRFEPNFQLFCNTPDKQAAFLIQALTTHDVELIKSTLNLYQYIDLKPVVKNLYARRDSQELSLVLQACLSSANSELLMNFLLDTSGSENNKILLNEALTLIAIRKEISLTTITEDIQQPFLRLLFKLVAENPSTFATYIKHLEPVEILTLAKTHIYSSTRDEFTTILNQRSQILSLNNKSPLSSITQLNSLWLTRTSLFIDRIMEPFENMMGNNFYEYQAKFRRYEYTPEWLVNDEEPSPHHQENYDHKILHERQEGESYFLDRLDLSGKNLTLTSLSFTAIYYAVTIVPYMAAQLIDSVINLLMLRWPKKDWSNSADMGVIGNIIMAPASLLGYALASTVATIPRLFAGALFMTVAPLVKAMVLPAVAIVGVMTSVTANLAKGILRIGKRINAALASKQEKKVSSPLTMSDSLDLRSSTELNMPALTESSSSKVIKLIASQPILTSPETLELKSDPDIQTGLTKSSQSLSILPASSSFFAPQHPPTLPPEKDQTPIVEPKSVRS